MNAKTWNPIGFILLAIGVVLGGSWVLASNSTVMFPGVLSSPNASLSAWEITLVQLFMLVVFALSIAALVLFVLWLGRRVIGIEASPDLTASPETILKMRFAKGEITREQFNEMRRALVEPVST